MKSSFVSLGMASAQLDSTGLLQLRALTNLSIRVDDQAAPVGCEALVAPGFKFGVKVFPAGSSSSVERRTVCRFCINSSNHGGSRCGAKSINE